MIDREALTVALVDEDRFSDPLEYPGVIVAAAREHLALLESSDIILIRKVDGEWPEWATSVSFTEVFTAEDRNPGLRFRTMPEVLDALSDSLAKPDGGTT